MNGFRTYTADQILQIVDHLIVGGEISAIDAAAMTKLGLMLKLIESTPDAEMSAAICASFEQVKEFQETTLPAALAQ